MAELRSYRYAPALTERMYAPKPQRSQATRLWSRAATCVAALLTAGAMASHYRLLQTSEPPAPCLRSHSSPLLQNELALARFALEKEMSARAAAQQAADVSGAEARRMRAELRFLREQSKESR